MNKIKLTIISFLMMASAIIGLNSVSAATATNDTITRTVTGVTNPVTNDFGYTITADSNNPAGGVTGVPTTATVSFNNVSPTSGTATATATVDLSGANFTKIGDYKFTVKEVSSTDATTYPVDSTTHDFYVQVVYETDANNVPTDNLIATLVTKGLNYTSEAKFTDISISKNVTGDIADKNEYFEFNIVLTGTQIHNGDTFTITGQSKDGAPTTCVIGTSCKVFLKHGETATIKDLPIGAKYTITESGATEYKTYIDGSSTEDTDKACDEKTIAATDNTTAFVNNKESTTITGIFINLAPFIILFALAIGGIYTIRKTAKNN